MKSSRHKKNQLIKELKIYRLRRKRRIWKSTRNYFLNILPKDERSLNSHLAFNKSERKNIVIPEIFSTDMDVEIVLEIIARCKNTKVSRREILFLNFKKVVYINAGALALLLSLVQDLSELKIRISGNLPKNSDARKEFIDSGFLEYFFDRQGRRAAACKNKILVKGKDQTDQVRTAMEIQKAMQTVFGHFTFNQQIQGALIEMMANSVNHAFPANVDGATWFFESISIKKRWYLSVFHDVAGRKVHFSFVDNGIGLLKTIRRGPFQKVVDKLKDSEILKNAFNGEYRSSTKKAERGRGLSTVKGAFEKNAVRNLRIVTNDRLYSFDNQESIKLTNSFDGTVYFWTLDETCNYGSSKN